MHPAPSLIAFTTLSGLGFGLLAYLGFGLAAPAGMAALWQYALAYALAGGGLMASFLHLGHPERALKAFSQWRTSWLSREGVLAVATLVLHAPNALSVILHGRDVPGLGELAGALALATVLATAMIYAQLKTVPRWRHWTTPLVFILAALAGGAVLAEQWGLAQVFLSWLAAALALHWLLGDRRFTQAGSTLGTATGLGAMGAMRVLERPHTGQNYLLTEMVHVVGRKHAARLRVIALLLACILPAILLWFLPMGPITAGLVAATHVAGMMCARWLFFAQAEHSVGLYYGMR